MTHAINWFEIPSGDFDRAVDFYTAVLERDIDLYEDDTSTNGTAGMFHTEDGEIGGMIVGTEEYTAESGATIPYKPTADSGVIVYLPVDGDLDDALDRVESNGGEVLVPKEAIPDMANHYAIVTDSEGNRIGLVSEE